MSFVTIQPEVLSSSAGDLQLIGSALSAGNAAAAIPTTGLAPAAADPVSALVATRFAMHGQQHQTISAQAEALHQHFVATMASSADSYAATEAANSAIVD